MRHETLPADHLFGRRVEMLTLAVLAQLRCRLNFHRIAREWMYGEPPQTRAGARGGRLLRLSRAQTVWICSRLVVPGRPRAGPP